MAVKAASSASIAFSSSSTVWPGLAVALIWKTDPSRSDCWFAVTVWAITLGRGKYDLGFGYAYLNFAKLNGKDLEDALTIRRIGLRTDRFDLTSHVFTLSVTRGLTDHLDVNLLLPLFFTALDLRATNTDRASTKFAATGLTESSALGVGDIFLRGKYRFGELLGADLAAGLKLRLPSGNEGDFQGRGRTTVTPSLIASRTWGPLEGHTSLGVEADTDPVEASRARYELGGVFNIVEHVAIFADVVGNSKFTGGETLPIPFPRTDIVDGIVGLKVEVGRRGLGYLAVRGPLTQDGLRADVIPSGGFELVF